MFKKTSSLYYKVILIAGILLIATAGVAWTDYFFEQSEYQQANHHLESIKQQIQSKFIQRTYHALNTLAKHPDIIEFENNPIHSYIQLIFDSVKSIEDAAIIYMMNTDGLVIASTYYDGNKTLLNKNYKFRPYFTKAMAGQTSVYPALGVTTDERGLYFSTPVYNQAQQIIAVLVIKQQTTPIDDILNNYNDPAFISVAPGVVFFSNQATWLFNRLPHISFQQTELLQQSRQFGEQQLPPLSFATDKPLIKIKQNKYLLRQAKFTPLDGHLFVFSQEKDTPLFYYLAIFIFIVIIAGISIALLQSIIDQKKIAAELVIQNKALLEAKAKAVIANQVKNNFLSNMSHETRTPMNAIIGVMDSLIDRVNPSSEMAKELFIVQNSAQSLLKILNDIYDFSKIEADTLELQCNHFMLRDLIDNIQHASFYSQKKHLNFVVNIDKNIPNNLLGDELRLKQILNNLLANAFKYTEKGSVFFKVSLVKQQQDRLSLGFHIADTGIGIDEQQLKNILKRFTFDDNAATHDYSSSGLSLAITAKLVELMGGELHISSQSHQGTRIFFSLNFSIDNNTQATDPQTSYHKQNNEQTAFEQIELSHLRVLLVEDNAINQLVAKKVLSKYCANIVIADNGAIAVDILSQQKFDVVFMDIQMPVMDGIQASKTIRTPDSNVLQHDVFIVAMTANTTDEDKQNCLNAGMNLFLSKPIKHDEIYQALITAAAQLNV